MLCDCREKVRRDEEAVATEEQLKQEQARRRNAEFRLERLKALHGLPSRTNEQAPDSGPSSVQDEQAASDSRHINLFEGLKVFPFGGEGEDKGEKKRSDDRKKGQMKRKREEPAPRSLEPVKKSGKKSIAELREERMKREKQEQERAQLLLCKVNGKFDRQSRRYSR